MANGPKKDFSKNPASKDLYKAANLSRFKESYTDGKPYYTELCTGQAVEVDTKNKSVQSWISNKIIVKES